MSRPSPKKAWCLTLNNYTESQFESLKEIASDETVTAYAVIGKEVGENGTPHLQMYWQFAKKQRLQQVKNTLGINALHCEERRGTPKQASDYCKKDGLFFEIGSISYSGKRSDLDSLVSDIKSGKRLKDLKETHGVSLIKYDRGIRSYLGLMSEPVERADVCGVWIWGPPGAGKSHYVRNAAPFNDDLYIKAQNKWWDGYEGQKGVLLDDFDILDKDGSNPFGHLIKIWTDKWKATGEIKGGTVNLQHDKFYVTSNHRLDECFSGVLYEAIRRRFVVYHKPSRDELILEDGDSAASPTQDIIFDN